MSAQVFVAKECAPGELRVAATPETVKRYVKEGLTVVVQAGAGARASADTGATSCSPASPASSEPLVTSAK